MSNPVARLQSRDGPPGSEEAELAKETLRLLEAWRAAERAAGAARLAAEHAQEAADAAELSAEAAKRAAEDAGVSLEAADLAAGGAKKAYHNHEAEIIEAEDKERAKGVPGGLGEPR